MVDMSKMRHPRAFKILTRAGPSFVAFCAGCIGLIAAVAEPFHGFRDWALDQFHRWWPIVTTPAFIISALILILLYLLALVLCGTEKRTEPPLTYDLQIDETAFGDDAAPASPILVRDQVYADFDSLENEKGEAVPDGYSIALCLWVTNGRQDGATLRKLQARFLNGLGESILLPIRGAEKGTLNLRHGEPAIVEIGRVAWFRPKTLHFVPAEPRGGSYRQVEDQSVIDAYTFANHRALKICDAFGTSKLYIGQWDGPLRAPGLKVVISADDVFSRTVEIETDLFAREARNWLRLSL